MKRGSFRFVAQHNSEDVEQESLFNWLQATRWRDRPLVTWYFAIPNGGTRHVLEAMKLKRTGVKRGVFDVAGIIAIPPYHGHFIEMKSAAGKLSPEQRDFRDLLTEEGYRADVCFSWHEATVAIERYLGRSSPVMERAR